MAENYSTPLTRFDKEASLLRHPVVVRSEAVEELRLRNIIYIFTKRSWLILLLTALGVSTAIVVTIAMHPVYSATVTIEVDKDAVGNINLHDQAPNAAVVASGMDLGTDLLTEESVLANDSTALTVINRLNLRSKAPYAYDPAALDKESPLVREATLPLDEASAVRARALEIYRQHLVVRLIKGTRLIEVTYTDPDPRQASAVANAVIDAYLSNYTRTRFETSAKVSEWLSQQLDDLKKNVETSQKKVTDFEEQSGLIGSTALSAATGTMAGENSNSVELNRLIDLNRQLTTAEIDRVGKEAVYRLTQTEDPDVVLGIGSMPLANALGANSAIVGPANKDITLLQQLREQQSALKIQYASAETTYGAKNPVLLQLQNQLNAVDNQISREMSRIRLLAKHDYSLSKNAEEGVRGSVRQQEREVSKLNSRTAQLEVLEQQARSNRRLYEDLYGKLQEVKMTSGVRASNTNVVNPARPADRPSSPKVFLNLSLGLALGLFCGCLATLVAEYFDDSVQDIDEIEGFTGAPILGMVPTFLFGRLANAPKTLLLGNDQKVVGDGDNGAGGATFLNAPNSPAAEAYRGLRTSLLAFQGEGRPRTVLFTSPESGDGKTTTCMNTAAALAQLGFRILILDADLRSSRLSRQSNVERGVGLSHVLFSQTDVMSIIRPSYKDVANLSILRSGDLPPDFPHPAELLASKRFRDVLKDLREKFDFVFVDSPPILSVTDAALLATQVDGIILVLRSGCTTRPVLRRALRLLQRVHATLLGTVLNRVNFKSAEYRTIDSEQVRST
jgi:succinoglycan biosynthesis transport protein ExoP